MRLTEVQVRQALQHSDKEVRFAALQYFNQSYSKNTAIMPDVIELVERLGPKDAFAYAFPISDLAQTEETITWAVNRLQGLPPMKPKAISSAISDGCSASRSAVVAAPQGDDLVVAELRSEIGGSVRTSTGTCIDIQRFALATTRSDLRSGQDQDVAERNPLRRSTGHRRGSRS